MSPSRMSPTHLPKRRLGRGGFTIRLDENGQVDEVVGTCHVHLEALSPTCISLILTDADDRQAVLYIQADIGGIVEATVAEEGE